MKLRPSLWWIAALAGAAFLLAHLPWLAWFLDDIDAINFAMGVREFDVARHQPHPPGYPIFILLGKLARSVILLFGGAPPGRDVEAGALAVWGAIGGGLAALPIVALFRQIDNSRRRALGAMLLTLASPLFWFTASRPLSDVPGLAVAFASQALAAAAFSRQRGWGARQRETGAPIAPAEIAASGRLIVLSALVAGLAVGLRSQTVWLTLPFLALVIVDRAGRAAAGALLGASLTFGIGVLLWMLPMLIATGGPARYVQALTSQAGEDFEGVDMLVTSAAPARRLLLNLLQTFVSPWVSLPLAVLVLAFALLGLLIMLRESRRGLLLLAGLVAPYAVFHLAFQENETVRYALPLVPPTAYLAVRGLDVLLRQRLFPIGVALLMIWCGLVGVPALKAYTSETSPIFELFADMTAATAGPAPTADAVGMHRRVFTESRRAREWAGPAFQWRFLPAPAGHEWLELVKYWREGGEGAIWFVADPHRTDLALIDPSARSFARRYRWPFRDVPPDPLSRALYRVFPAAFDDPALVGGARPDDMDWYVIRPPGWFLAEGWALTPETSGIAERDRKGPGHNQAAGYVRRRPDEVQVMIGGRNLGGPSEPVVSFSVALDGRVLETWEVAPAPGFFLRGLTLPAGALTGEGTFAELTVRAAAVGPGPAGTNGQPVRAAVEQFDLQPTDGVMIGYDRGWHEAEFDPRRGLSWRWSSDAATMIVWAPEGQDVDIKLRVESPGRYFDRPSKVVLRAGDQALATMSASDDFEIAARVPAAALKAAGNVLTLATDQVFVPAEHQSGGTDRRRLGLRVLEVSIAKAAAGQASRSAAN